MSTGNTRQMLKAGKFLTLIECTPMLYVFALVFGFFEGWWLFNDGRRHCLADVHFWVRGLVKAGFAEVAWLEEKELGREKVGRIDPQLIVAFM